MTITNEQVSAVISDTMSLTTFACPQKFEPYKGRNRSLIRLIPLGAAYSLNAEELYAIVNQKEIRAKVDTQEGTFAATPRTLNKIYEIIKIQWLTKCDDATTYFEEKNNGMVSLASSLSTPWMIASVAYGLLPLKRYHI